MRATARFSPGLINPQWAEILSELRRFDPADTMHERGLDLDMLTPGAVYEAAWPTLHSPPFYDEKTRSFHMGDWNERVRQEPDIKVNLKNRLTFQRNILITSMPHLELRDLWQPHFSVTRSEMPAYSLWESDGPSWPFPVRRRLLADSTNITESSCCRKTSSLLQRASSP